MKIEDFAALTFEDGKTEIQKAELLVFYLMQETGETEVAISHVIVLFEELHFNRPNTSRLAEKIKSNRRFVGARKGYAKLHADTLKELREKFSFLVKPDTSVTAIGSLIPVELYAPCPSYICSLADQVNASYEQNIFDGCAVLMRRLFEILLILAYRNLGIESEIKDASGNHKKLEAIVNDARTQSVLNLSRNTKTKLNDYRNLGNFSAHRIEYRARKGDIEKVSMDYRATIEELMHKAGMI